MNDQSGSSHSSKSVHDGDAAHQPPAGDRQEFPRIIPCRQSRWTLIQQVFERKGGTGQSGIFRIVVHPNTTTCFPPQQLREESTQAGEVVAQVALVEGMCDCLRAQLRRENTLKHLVDIVDECRKPRGDLYNPHAIARGPHFTLRLAITGWQDEIVRRAQRNLHLKSGAWMSFRTREIYERRGLPPPMYCIAELPGAGAKYVSLQRLSVAYTTARGKPLALLMTDMPVTYTVHEHVLSIWGAKETSQTTFPIFREQAKIRHHFKGYIPQYAPASAWSVDTLKQLMSCFSIYLFSTEQADTIQSMHRQLSRLKSKMTSDRTVQASGLNKHLAAWREFLEDQRVSIASLQETIEKMCANAPGSRPIESGGSPRDPTDGATSLTEYTDLLCILRHDRQDVERLQVRINKFHETLMSTFSIMANVRSIEAANSVAKVTGVAFFYIPISYVATLLGMNVAFAENVPFGSWLGLSVIASLATYLALYWNLWRRRLLAYNNGT